MASEDLDHLPEPEKAHVRARDRKVRGPRVVVDNAGLRKVTMELARRRRSTGPPPDPKGRPAT